MINAIKAIKALWRRHIVAYDTDLWADGADPSRLDLMDGIGVIDEEGDDA